MGILPILRLLSFLFLNSFLPILSHTRAMPCSVPQIRKFQPYPCQIPENIMASSRLIWVRVKFWRLPPSGM